MSGLDFSAYGDPVSESGKKPDFSAYGKPVEALGETLADQFREPGGPAVPPPDVPDVFSEGAAQAAAPAERFLPEVQRAGLGALSQLSMASAGALGNLMPLRNVPESGVPHELTDPLYRAADVLGEKAAAIPQSSTGAQLLQMPLAGIPGILGSDRGREVIQAGGTPEQAQAATALEAGANIASLGVPLLGKTIPARILMQEAAAPGIQEAQRELGNQILPESMQTPYAPSESALAALVALPFALMPGAHSVPLKPREAAVRDAAIERAQALQTDQTFQPPTVPETPPSPAMPVAPQVEPGAAATLPAEPSDVAARSAVPAEVPGGATGEREPVVPAATDEAATAAGGEGQAPAGAVTPEFAAKLDTHAADIAEANPEVAHTVSQLADRAKAAGLTSDDITPFHGETDAEYIDRVTAELADYEAKHAATPDNGPDQSGNPPDLRREIATVGVDQGANAATAEGQAGQGVPRRQAEPAATAPAETVETSSGSVAVDRSHDVPLLGSSLKDGTVVLDKDWEPVISPERAKTSVDAVATDADTPEVRQAVTQALSNYNRTKPVVVHEVEERKAENRGIDYTKSHTDHAEPAEHAQLLSDLGLKPGTPEADLAIRAYEHTYKPDLVAAAQKKNPNIAPDMLEKPYDHPENVEQRRMLAEVQAKEPSTTAQEGRAEEPQPASITKAAIEAEREASGKAQVETPSTTNADALEQAKAQIAADPGIALRTTGELIANPEAADPVKKAILAHDRQRIETQLREAADAVKNAKDDDARAAAQVQRDLADLDLDLNDKAARATGTASGQSLQAQKISVLPGYSLGKVLSAAKEASGGKLPEAVRTELEAATARIAELEAKLAKRAKATEPKVTPDEKMQAKVKAQIEKLEGQIKQRLSACPI